MRSPSLLLSLFLSFLVLRAVGVGRRGGRGYGRGLVRLGGGLSGYWLVFAVLQVRWWRQGYEDFWRPAYAWSLFVLLCLSLIFLPLLLVARFRPWLFHRMNPTGKGDVIELFDALARWIGIGTL